MRRHPLGLTACVLAASALVAAVVLRRRYAVVTVDGPSMLPALTDGDRVLVRRAVVGQLRRGQVVVAGQPRTGAVSRAAGPRAPRRWLIKRVAAVPGDPRPATLLPAWAEPAERRVPEGKYVLLGDNAAVSSDSRQSGYFDESRLLGIAIRRMCPRTPAGRTPGGQPRAVRRGSGHPSTGLLADATPAGTVAWRAYEP